MEYGEAVYLLCLKGQEYYAELETAFESNGEKWAEEIADTVISGKGKALPRLPNRPAFIVVPGEETRDLLLEFEMSYDELRESLKQDLLNNIKKLLLKCAGCDDKLFKQWEERLNALVASDAFLSVRTDSVL